MNVPATIPAAVEDLTPYAPPPRVFAPVGIFSSPEKFEHAQRVAKVFASSQLVPPHFRDKMADCLIALNIADRMLEDPLVVFQNLAIVNGRPAWQTQYMIARANRAGVFRGPITWKSDGKGESLTVTAQAVLAATGEVVHAEVSMAMATADGWTKNPKYKTMPEHMLKWRSAAFLVRLYAPEVMIGIPTAEEVEIDAPPRDVTPRPRVAAIPSASAPPAIPAAPETYVEPEAIVRNLDAGLSRFEDDLAAARSLADVDDITEAFAEAIEECGRDLRTRAQNAVEAAQTRLEPKPVPQPPQRAAPPPAPPVAQDDTFPGDLPLDPAEEGEETEDEYMARVFEEGAKSAREKRPRNVIPRPFASDPQAKARFEVGWDSVGKA